MIVDFHSHDFPDSLATRAMRGMCRMTEGRLWPVGDGSLRQAPRRPDDEVMHMGYRMCRMLLVVVALALAGCCSTADRTRFMTYNVRIGCGHDDPFKLEKGALGHLPQCAEVIRRAAPDFVAIQEIDRGSDRVGGVDQTVELAKLCGMHGTFVPKVPQPGGEYGLAILSREKPLAVEKVLMPGSAHTRCLMVCEFESCIVANTHFPLTPETCLNAAKIVRCFLRGRAKPVVLMGDFNTMPDESALAELRKDFTLLSDPKAFTWPAKAPDQTIDYIMVDKPHVNAFAWEPPRTIAAPEATDHCAIVVTGRQR